jgi:hypothetical protein
MAATAEAAYQTLEAGSSYLDGEESKALPEERPSVSWRPVPVIFEKAEAGPPSQILFGAFNHPLLRLRKPIPLSVSTEEGKVVVAWTEIDEFGCGDNTSSAVDDFRYTLGELYDHLNAGVRLGADLQRVKHTLSEYIEPRRT